MVMVGGALVVCVGHDSFLLLRGLLVWKSSSQVCVMPHAVSATRKCVRARTHCRSLTRSQFAQTSVQHFLALAFRINLVFFRLKWLRTPRDN